MFPVRTGMKLIQMLIGKAAPITTEPFIFKEYIQSNISEDQTADSLTKSGEIAGSTLRTRSATT